MAVDERSKPFVTIVQVVADHYKVKADALVAPQQKGYRPRYLDEPRRVAMMLVRETGASFPEIGRFFNRDHTTVIYACRTAAEETGQVTLIEIREKLAAAMASKPGDSCPRCRQLQLDLMSLKAELLEFRARMGCG
jgi:hypothetical protein